MSLADGNLPLLIPPNPVNQDLDIMRLPTMTLADLTADDEYESGARILVVLKGLVFDVTGMKEAFSPRGLFEFYPKNDITYALAKGSVSELDARVGGESGLTDREKENLERWFTIFKNRFEIIGKTDQVDQGLYSN
ncbi:hypothetical protein R3P38DRAFT_3288379 [Favolaschia claudopus]|uniref:Cytochrome b5 heme-binding domain-containing protein n=1 Tax=Favolaschia claudopus TaxID=2862362 RepID=A0AAV9ZWV5_9AGAR